MRKFPFAKRHEEKSKGLRAKRQGPGAKSLKSQTILSMLFGEFFLSFLPGSGKVALTMLSAVCYKNHSCLARKFVALAAQSFRSSSMAEHSAVNRRVVGSSPTCGANFCSRLHPAKLARLVLCSRPKSPAIFD